MNNISLKSESERQYAEACLVFAEKIGLIDDSGLEAVKIRCENENAKRKEKHEKGEAVYGLLRFSLPEYLDYELTRFKLDFVSESEEIKRNYNYREISEKEKKAFYKANRDLFTRFNGERFTYREVKMIVKKKIREEEYENEINNILCQLTDGQ